jgi:hypothetical protein
MLDGYYDDRWRLQPESVIIKVKDYWQLDQSSASDSRFRC